MQGNRGTREGANTTAGQRLRNDGVGSDNTTPADAEDASKLRVANDEGWWAVGIQLAPQSLF